MSAAVIDLKKHPYHWVLTFDEARECGLIYHDADTAYSRFGEAKACLAMGWDLEKFIEEWF